MGKFWLKEIHLLWKAQSKSTSKSNSLVARLKNRRSQMPSIQTIFCNFDKLLSFFLCFTNIFPFVFVRHIKCLENTSMFVVLIGIKMWKVVWTLFVRNCTAVGWKYRRKTCFRSDEHLRRPEKWREHKWKNDVTFTSCDLNSRLYPMRHIPIYIPP